MKTLTSASLSKEPESIEPAWLVHFKKLEVDLTQENVISVALWIHLGPGSGPPPVAMVKGYTPFPVKDSSKT